MDLNTIWFILIAILFIGFFFLEGFDFGVGGLLPILGRNDEERRVIINTIGPFWDGNEVWLITAGGATFAAFPHWYATMFSGFYLALVLMLLALIVRGVSFEFRSKSEGSGWRTFWDWMLFTGSVLPALLWGVAIANLMLGLPIDGRMEYVGGFLNLLSPFAILGGLAFVALFFLHGAIFLTLRTTGVMLEKARRAALFAWFPAVVLVALFVVFGYFVTDIFTRPGALGILLPFVAAVALLASGALIRSRRSGWAFAMTGVAIIVASSAIFLGMFPRVMISSLNPDWSLTIYTAASSPYTLGIMTIVAAVFVPIVLVYEAWTYWVFRHRVTGGPHLEY